MKSVLISICPRWCNEIAIGKKTIEVRKSMPKLERPFKCYIYMSQGDLKDLGSYSEWIYKNRMKVIGEFICDKVYLIKNQGIRFSVADEEQSVTNKIARQSRMNYDDMVGYLGNKDGYGWHISNLKIYDKPKELSEVFKPCPTREKGDCLSCLAYNEYDEVCANNLTRPPQSWQYVEELIK